MKIPARTLLLVAMSLLLCSATSTLSALSLHGIFVDHMVLQQDTQVRVWGWAEAGETVEVIPGWDEKEGAAAVEVAEDGKWSVMIKTPKADGKSYKLVAKAGAKTITVKDVVLGEVWLTGGQSNMSMGMTGWKEQPILGGPKDIAAASYPLIRVFNFRGGQRATVADNISGGIWSVCTPEAVKGFSATAFYFAREIHLEAKCPVGVIHTAVGGVKIERWIGREFFENDEELQPILESWDKKNKVWETAALRAKQDGRRAPRSPHDQMPCWAYNGIIAPLKNMTLRGMAWYQGEANVKNGQQYRKLLPLMINNWRTDFGDPDLEFLMVQIANHTDGAMPWKLVPRYVGQPRESGHAEVREAQLMATKLKNTGLAVAIDIGDSNCIHPKNKRDVGKRLALWTLAKHHGLDVVYSGPLYSGHDVEGGRIRVRFDHAEGGLLAKATGKLKGFAIAGKDRRFVWADAEISEDGQSVLVSSSKVESPLAVRYAWDMDPDVSLYNAAKLPASPFRTDGWRGIAYGK